MHTASSKLRIVVLGYIIRGPLGGLVWHHLQYVLGLKKMGHEVLFFEDSEDYVSCYNPETDEMTTDPAYGLKFIKEVFDNFSLENQWAYHDVHHNQWYGLPEKQVKDYCASADLLLNISGVNPLKHYTIQVPKRVLIDTDPVFTQIRHLTETDALQRAKKHTHFFSFGENFGKEFCSIPDDGFTWLPTRQPVVFNAWKYSEGNIDSKWTSVMQWDSYRVREYNGRSFGMKSKSFAPYIDLPKYSPENFKLAIGSPTVPTEMLQEKGWQVLNPLIVIKTAESYQQFIQQSKGEWSIAKEGYVMTNSGWFSERTTCYLASGRPVIVQDTGFSSFLETGNGLLTFTSLEEAMAAIDKVNSNYNKHCKDARSIAEEYFESGKVLTELIEKSIQ